MCQVVRNKLEDAAVFLTNAGATEQYAKLKSVQGALRGNRYGIKNGRPVQPEEK